MTKFSIGTKIAIAFSVVLILLLAIAIITFRNLSKIEQDNTWVVHTQEVLKTINLLQSSLQDTETGGRGFIITGKESYLEPYDAGVASCMVDLKQLKELTSDNPTQQQHCGNLEKLIPKKLAELARTIELRRSTGFNAAMEVVLSDKGKKVMDDIRAVLNSMTGEEAMLFEQRTLETVNSQENAKIPIYITLIVAFVVVILLIIFLTRNIATPIRLIAQIADKIASGQLDTKIPINRNDEIGDLGDSFRVMQKTLQQKATEAREIADGNLTIEIGVVSENDEMGKSFKSMVEKLRQQLGEIGEGVNILASSSSEIMASVTQMASSSVETATSVSETTTTVEEVKQTAEVSNQKAKAVSENAVRTAEISSEGTKAIANTIEGMNKIRQQMTAIAAMVVRLSEQSQTIGEITASVNELAEQSNLLAVNAAIEAAKAGEQGKGFTVVAQEIKMLADRSKEATSQVRNILRDVQKSISSAVMATEEGGKAVDEGLKLTTLTGDTIKTLSESVTEAAKAAIQITASSQQQLEGMDQVVAAMENIREASMQAAAGTEQSVESVNELQKVGQKLDELMKQYRL